MGSKRRVAWGVLWNWASIGTDVALTLLLTPFLIHSLGDTTYGLFIVLGSLGGYFALLDFGLRGAVGRFVAFYRARQDPHSVNETLSTAGAVLGALGVAALVLFVGGVPLFFAVFDVPPDQVGDVRTALLFVGLTFMAVFGLAIFESTLWGYHRLDLINVINLITSVVRAGLVFYVVSRGGGLTELMAITFSTILGNGLVKAILCFALDRGIRLRPALVTRRAFREMFGYSVWNFLALVGKNTRLQLSPLLIGALLGVAFLTPFSVAARLTAYAVLVLETTAEVLTPLATALFARGDRQGERRLLIVGTRCCFALSLYLTAALVVLGGPFVRLWIGPDLANSAAPLAVILMLGELVPASLLVGRGFLLARGRHRSLAVLSLCEAASACLLIALLVRAFELTGAMVALAVSAALFRGILLIAQVCRVAEVPIWHFVRDTLVGPLTATLVPAAALGLVAAWSAPQSWLEWVLYGAGYTLAFALSAGLVLGVKGLPLPSFLARRGVAVGAVGDN